MKVPRNRLQLQLDLRHICWLIKISMTIERCESRRSEPNYNLSCCVFSLLNRYSMLTSVWDLTFCVSHIKTIYNVLTKPYFPPFKSLRMPPCSLWSLWQRIPAFSSTDIFDISTTTLTKCFYLWLSLFCCSKSIKLLPQ